MLRENDYGTLAIDSAHSDVTRVILQARCEMYVNEWMGRQLPRLYAEAGLDDITIEPTVIVQRDCIATEKRLGLNFTLAASRAREAGRITADEEAAWLMVSARAQ